MGQHRKSIEKQLEGLRSSGAQAGDGAGKGGSKDANAELLNLRREQFALRLQRATGQAPKPDQFGKVRRNIARIKTVQAELRARKTGDKA